METKDFRRNFTESRHINGQKIHHRILVISHQQNPIITIMWHHCIITLKTDRTKCWQGFRTNRTQTLIIGIKWSNHFGKLAIFQKFKYIPTLWHSISSLGYYLGEVKPCVHKKICLWMSISGIFIFQTWNHPNIYQHVKWINKCGMFIQWDVPQQQKWTDYWHTQQHKRISKYYTEGSKSDTKMQVP